MLNLEKDNIDLDATISFVESSLDAMYAFMRKCPAPCIIYNEDDSIKWANKSMLNLYFGTKSVPKILIGVEVYGKPLEEFLPSCLTSYIRKQNKKTREIKKAQLESWVSQPGTIDIDWSVLRFPMSENSVGVVLFPQNQAQLDKCIKASKL